MRRDDGRYIITPTYERYVDAFCVVLVLAFLGYLGGHIVSAVVR